MLLFTATNSRRVARLGTSPVRRVCVRDRREFPHFFFGFFWRRENFSLSSLSVFCSTFFFNDTPSAFTRSRSASMASSVDSWPLLFHMCADGKSHYSPDGDLTSQHDGPALVCTFIEEISRPMISCQQSGRLLGPVAFVSEFYRRKFTFMAGRTVAVASQYPHRRRPLSLGCPMVLQSAPLVNCI